MLTTLLAAASIACADIATLRESYAALLPELSNNPYLRPLHIESHEAADNKLTGEVYARLDHPYAVVAASLADPANWCDILLLHLNTKYCHAEPGKNGSVISLYVGKKVSQPVQDAYRIDLNYRLVTQTPDYLDIRLDAAQGPLGTHDYEIRLEAIPVDARNSFLHFTYAYAYGTAGRLAMQAYLATLGRGKVGFTVIGKQADGRPDYIGGMLGVTERNTMRYYLAIEVYLGALDVPPRARPEKRFRDWFAATEQYARQLHELDQAEYLAMKLEEYARQQSVAPP